jgi:hypothetical protein
MDLRMEDWDVSYAGNRFSWLGNGFSQTELDSTADWAYYIRDNDDDGPLSTAGRRKVISKSGTCLSVVKPSFLPTADGKKGDRPNL